MFNLRSVLLFVRLLVLLVLLSTFTSCSFSSNKQRESTDSAEIRVISVEQSVSYRDREWPTGTLFMSATLHGLDICPDDPFFSVELSPNPKWAYPLTGLYESEFITRSDLSEDEIPLKRPESPSDCYYEQIIPNAFTMSMLTDGDNCAIDSLIISFDAYDGNDKHRWQDSFSCSELKSVLYSGSIAKPTETAKATGHCAWEEAIRGGIWQGENGAYFYFKDDGTIEIYKEDGDFSSTDTWACREDGTLEWWGNPPYSLVVYLSDDKNWFSLSYYTHGGSLQGSGPYHRVESIP